MSESRSTRNRLPLLTAMVVLSVALIGLGGPALALEGIQGKYAIFYPSIDLQYEHTDNLFYTSQNETAANTFLARPIFKLEIPNQRHYFAFSYMPTFRDNDEIDLEQDWSHDLKMKARFQATPILNIEIEDHYVRGSVEVSEVDPNGELVFGLDPFDANTARLAFIFEGQKQYADIHIVDLRNDWDRDVLEPGFLSSSNTGAGFEYGYKFRPLTKFLLGYDFVSSTEDFVVYNVGVDSLDSDYNRLHVGFRQELGRTTTGTVRVGYLNQNFDADNVSDYSGLWLKGDIQKAFTRFTKLAVEMERSSNFSNFDNNSYYVANRLGLQVINQPLGRRVFWAVRAGYQRNDYPDPSPLYSFITRQDDILRLDGEIGFHPLTHLNFKVNYRHEERDSNIDDLSYNADHWLFSVNFGF